MKRAIALVLGTGAAVGAWLLISKTRRKRRYQVPIPMPATEATSNDEAIQRPTI